MLRLVLSALVLSSSLVSEPAPTVYVKRDLLTGIVMGSRGAWISRLWDCGAEKVLGPLRPIWAQSQPGGSESVLLPAMFRPVRLTTCMAS